MPSKLSLGQKVRVIERMMGETGQLVRNMADYIQGAIQQLGQSIYTVAISNAAVVELLGEEQVKAKIVEIEQRRAEQRAAEDEERARRAQELADLKAAQSDLPEVTPPESVDQPEPVGADDGPEDKTLLN
jgi:hypothetical protein